MVKSKKLNLTTKKITPSTPSSSSSSTSYNSIELNSMQESINTSKTVAMIEDTPATRIRSRTRKNTRSTDSDSISNVTNLISNDTNSNQVQKNQTDSQKKQKSSSKTNSDRNSNSSPKPSSSSSSSSSATNSSTTINITNNGSSTNLSESDRERRPKRASSQNVDYNLKKRRIFKSPIDDEKLLKKTPKQEDHINTDEKLTDNNIQLIERNSKGRIIKINDINVTGDVKNAVTGIALSRGPPEKIKRESLWNNKKIVLPDSNNTLELKLYKTNLKTNASDDLTKESSIRQDLHPIDIHNNERLSNVKKNTTIIRINLKNNSILPSNSKSLSHPHTKTKNKELIAKEQNSKLFGKNTLNHIDSEDDNNNNSEPEIENEDFCSSCGQTGSFVCCDTCPKSFHFLCLDPPLDPDNLPEGNWSCPNCQFKQIYPNKIQARKAENNYLKQIPNQYKAFGKLLFNLKSMNTKQFELPASIKDTFKGVRTGNRGQYIDHRRKDMPTERQLFGSPYGQSITKLDTYSPDSHINGETGQFLICYKCRTTRMGTWDDYEKSSRLIIKCDYCETPWHLDCIPDIPRASLKNLGSKWRCPLHAFNDSSKRKHKRRLAKNQKTTESFQTCGYKNDGDIEIIMDEISAPMADIQNSGNMNPIPLLHENSVKLDFFNKIYKAKNVQNKNNLKIQENMIDKLLDGELRTHSDEKTVTDLNSFLYFTVSNTPQLKKHWDFKELCLASESILDDEIVPDKELQQLKYLKKILESKPKEEILQFFNLSK
ncbi:hypothetical protein TBLA_0G02280 [Henningerozyma blattae CBS 6284]|uniref:PHD-type domain-containing protein n=1 Tax=Henningerozyma blattae (strain ATCC 34711 / CBS 6284 / DSM 70876 / NBRC 10599 / NRRL Y-10934 / UCD 77-7) TaxID=1071380 RepID=I2H716_HENB6|nr:hypothetical protein TBLA_0G02280 [Tetrapisispora blattae CBS 6284]CCH62168.1 hypothetical protein TBLA_0G02280 [Tetrapisispora blattae CBS 6284]